MRNAYSLLQYLLTLYLACHVDGFSLKPAIPAKALKCSEDNVPNNGVDATTSRKAFINKLVFIPVLVGATGSIEPAFASGGATAGGAYLLSAKQRYNERVKTSVKGLLAAGEELNAGSSKAAKAYFASEEAGGWKDLTAAGYLLSNAFRRNSTAAPDSLPSVKKYKAFAAEVDNLQKVLKKKGAAAAAEEFPKVEAALDAWLGEIELPAAKEL